MVFLVSARFGFRLRFLLLMHSPNVAWFLVTQELEQFLPSLTFLGMSTPLRSGGTADSRSVWCLYRCSLRRCAHKRGRFQSLVPRNSSVGPHHGFLDLGESDGLLTRLWKDLIKVTSQAVGLGSDILMRLCDSPSLGRMVLVIVGQVSHDRRHCWSGRCPDAESRDRSRVKRTRASR